MQKYQAQAPLSQPTPTFIRPDSNYIDCNHQTVRDFLQFLHLEQYLDIFIEEGFDSITSLLEITEEDMICMNVKRGHRRLIQREIATNKGIPRDQPLVTNIMGPKYPTEFLNATTFKMEDTGKRPNGPSNTGYVNAEISSMMPNYDIIVTGLTSPRSMNSGVGGSSVSGCSGNSYSSTLRSRMPGQPSEQVSTKSHQSIQPPQLQQQQQPNFSSYLHQSQPPTSRSQHTDSGISSNSNMSFLKSHNNDVLDSKAMDISSKKDDNRNSNNMNVSGMDMGSSGDSSILVATRSNSTSSNDDNDSIDTNDSVPTKRKYRRHAKPDRNAPVKPPSAYIMFSNDARAQLKDQNLSFAELAKIVGEQWKNLSHSERQNYERMAMRAKDEYLAALEQYRQTPQYDCYQRYLSNFKAKQDAANRQIGRARKRAKHPSPGSGSIADFSSNGNSNGNGSSGSGSGGDTFDNKETRRQGRSSDEEMMGGQSQQAPEYNSGNSSSSSGNNISQIEPLRHPHHHHHHHHHYINNTGSGSGSGSGSGGNNSNNSNSNPRSSDSGYQSQRFNNQQNNDYRSSQIMRGMLPVEFNHHTPPSHPYPYPTNTQQQQLQLASNKSIPSSNARKQRSVSSIETLDPRMDTFNGEHSQARNEDVDMYEEDEVDDEVDEDISPDEARARSHCSNNNNHDRCNADNNMTDQRNHDNHSGNDSADSSSSCSSNISHNNNRNSRPKRRSPRIAKAIENTNANHSTADNSHMNNSN